MQKISVRQFELFAWSLTAIFVLMAFVAWVQANDWGTTNIFSSYILFPLLGLIAFSIMLCHYVNGAFRKLLHFKPPVLSSYYKITAYIVLLCLLLHPGLLVWQLWRDGLGLPPGSYIHYIADGTYVFLLFGIVSLIAFLAYEFKRIYNSRRWWWVVERASDLAMILVYFHALVLGVHLQTGWYRYIWYAYGIVLASCLVFIYLNIMLKHINSKPLDTEQK